MRNSTTTTLLLVTLLLVFFTSCKKNANHDLAELQPAENFDISKAPFDSTLVVTFFESHPLLQNTSLMLINYIKI
jgi:hypothetical protein